MTSIKNTATQPLVWLPVDRRLLGEDGSGMHYAVVADKYLRAVKVGAAAQPVLFPLAEESQISALLSLVDGVMLTGSPSNVHPSHFNQPVEDPTLPLDPERDALTLALVKACVSEDIPILGICRGFQEINVALGGSLLQTVHAQPGKFDHRGPEQTSVDDAYRPTHEIEFEPDSQLAKWARGTKQQVNSLHGQGIDRLAKGLRAVGHASDGLVEAVEIEGAQNFAVAVQFHPEWRVSENYFYSAIFEAFGNACRQRHAFRQMLGKTKSPVEPGQLKISTPH